MPAAIRPLTWESYVGQEALKRRLKISIISAQRREAPLDHVLLASGMPGVGKTTMARLIAKELGVTLVEMVPPMTPEAIANKCSDLSDGDVLFIDEVHKLADGGKRGAEILLKLLEELQVTVAGDTIQLPNLTIIAATTDADMLPEPVLDRFKIRPSFEKYTLIDMCEIVKVFAGRHSVALSDDLTTGIAIASRFTPRVIEEFIMATRDLTAFNEGLPSVDEVLDFQQVTADGLTLLHVGYLKCLLGQKRTNRHGDVICEAGETLLASTLRETRQGIRRAERYLMELGYVERTMAGRRLSADGIQRAHAL